MVLLINADHFLMKVALMEVGAGAAALLAGAQPEPIRLGIIPWAPRGLILLPVLQVLGITAALLRLRQWRQHIPKRVHRAVSGGRCMLWGLSSRICCSP